MKPVIEKRFSPNFRRCNGERKVTCVIIHATATSGIESPLAWLSNKDSKVSAHYLIGLDGRTIQLVDERNVAWHAGESVWKDQPNVNSFSIGIELVNANDEKMAYPEEQLTSCAGLVADICLARKLSPADVIGHKDIAPGRKTDPAGFPWDDFRLHLVDLGVR